MLIIIYCYYYSLLLSTTIYFYGNLFITTYLLPISHLTRHTMIILLICKSIVICYYLWGNVVVFKPFVCAHPGYGDLTYFSPMSHFYTSYVFRGYRNVTLDQNGLTYPQGYNKSFHVKKESHQYNAPLSTNR